MPKEKLLSKLRRVDLITSTEVTLLKEAKCNGFLLLHVLEKERRVKVVQINVNALSRK